jgi:hypothetical protein
MKMLLSADESAVAQYRDANGGKQLVHTSQGFWRDWHGRPVEGFEEASRIAMERTAGGEWRLVFHPVE